MHMKNYLNSLKQWKKRNRKYFLEIFTSQVTYNYGNVRVISKIFLPTSFN